MGGIMHSQQLDGYSSRRGGWFGYLNFGKSFVRNDMQIVQMPGDWPPLPMTEVAIVGEKPEFAELVQALIAFLTESVAANVTQFPISRVQAHAG